MKHYRISKYDPQYSVNKIYQIDDWTDYSDIGKVFNGTILTTEKYEEIELKYLQCIAQLLEYLHVQSVRLMSVELYDTSLPWRSNTEISAQSAIVFLKDCLRNKCWGQLQHKTMLLYNGWDFYLHVKCRISYHKLRELTNYYDLFLEEWL